MILAHELVGRHDAPAVVLVHGITESHRSWHPLIEPLARHHSVLAVDLRGHGDSDHDDPYDMPAYAGDVIETYTALGMRDVLLVGHSLGGAVVTAAAAMAPCAAVVNVDQPLRLAAFKDALTAIEPALKGTSANFTATMQAMYDSMAGPLGPVESARLSSIRRPDQTVVLGTWQTVFDSTPEQLDATVGAMLSGVTVPYLSLHGDDPGDDYATWLTSHCANATIEVWPGHGHYPHLVDQQRFLDRIMAFEAEVRG